MGICLDLANGSYTVNANPLPGVDGVCASPSAAVGVSLAEYQEYVLLKTGDIGGITSADVLYSFTWGFGAVMLFWFFGWTVGVVLESIRKI